MTECQYPTREDISALLAARAHLTPEERVRALEAAIRRYGKILGQLASVRQRQVGQKDADSPLMRALEFALRREMGLAQRAIVDAACVLDPPEHVCYLDLVFGPPPGGHIVTGEPPPPVSTKASTLPPVLVLPDTMQEVFRLMTEFGMLPSEFYEREVDVRVLPRLHPAR